MRGSSINDRPEQQANTPVGKEGLWEQGCGRNWGRLGRVTRSHGRQAEMKNSGLMKSVFHRDNWISVDRGLRIRSLKAGKPVKKPLVEDSK